MGWTSIITAALLVGGQAGAGHQEPRSLPVGACLNLERPFGVEGSTNAWQSPVAAADLERIRAASFKTVRIPLSWSHNVGPAPDFRIDEAYLARVEGLVDMALADGLNVIIDDHDFIQLRTEPEAHAAELAAIWGQVARHFASRPVERLWFEIENEPQGALTNRNLLAVLGPSLAAIRATNPDRPVLLGGGDWSSVGSLATLPLPSDPAVFPTFHYYTPMAFTHQGATWTARAYPPGRVFGSPADRKVLAADAARVEAFIRRRDVVPILGETGTISGAVDQQQRNDYLASVRQAFAPLGVPICTWAYSGAFGLYDRRAGQWLPGALAAVGLAPGE